MGQMARSEKKYASEAVHTAAIVQRTLSALNAISVCSWHTGFML
jgi:hypothetical protein